MNESHERRLVATFRYIDVLLGEAVHIVATADIPSLHSRNTRRTARTCSAIQLTVT
jgi:hypothetical protein